MEIPGRGKIDRDRFQFGVGFGVTELHQLRLAAALPVVVDHLASGIIDIDMHDGRKLPVPVSSAEV